MPLSDTTGKLKTIGGNSPEKVFKQHNPQRSNYYSGLGKMAGQRSPQPQYPPKRNNVGASPQHDEHLSKGEEYVPKSMLENLHQGLMDMGFIRPYSDNNYYDDLDASDLFDLSPNKSGDDPYKNHPMNLGKNNGPRGGDFTSVQRQPKLDLEPVTTAINNLTSEFKAEAATFKLIEGELKKHTEQLKKINIAIDKLSPNVQGTGLDMPSNIFDRGRGKGLPTGKTPPKTPSTSGNTASKMGNAAKSKLGSLGNAAKSKLGGLGTKTRSMLSAAKGIAKNAAARGMASKATIAAGRILARANPVGLVASAGMAGWAVGSAIANKYADSDLMKGVGHGLAKAASVFSSDALEAVNTQEKSDSGASGTKVTTQKTGQVYTPSDPKISGILDWASKEFNIPKEEIYATAYQESKFDPKARAQSSGGAVGLFQFMESTWNSVLEKYPDMAKKYGIGKADKSGRDDRLDPKKSAVMYGLLRNSDKAMLKGASSGNSTTDSYLTHLLGGPAAKKVLDAYQHGDGNNPISKYVSAEAMNANKNLMFGADGKPLSVNDFLRTIYNKSGSRAAAYKEQFDKGGQIPSVGESPKTGSGATPAGTTGATPKTGSGATPAGTTGASPKAGSGATPTGTPGASPKAGSGATPAGKSGATPTGKSGEHVQYNSKPTGSQAPVGTNNKISNTDGESIPNIYGNQTTIDQALAKNSQQPTELNLKPANTMEQQNKMFSALSEDSQPNSNKSQPESTQPLMNSNDMGANSKQTSMTPAMQNASNSGSVSGKALPTKPSNTQGSDKGSQLAVRNTSSTIQRIFEKDFQLGV